MHKQILKSTPYGAVAIVWRASEGRPRVARVMLSSPGEPADRALARAFPVAKSASCADIDSVAAAIMGILEGESITIPLDVAELELCRPFRNPYCGRSMGSHGAA